ALERLFAPLAAPPTPPPVLPAPTPSLEQVQAAYQDGDVEAAFAILSNLPGGYDRTALLLGCAAAMSTLASCKVALQAFEDLPAAEQSRLLRVPHLKLAHAQIERLIAAQANVAVPPPPGNWLDWFRRLDDPGNLDLAKVARQAAGHRSG